MDSNLAYLEERQTEIIGGNVRMMSSATANHYRVSGNIYNIFSNYLRGRRCEPFPDGMDLFLEEGTEEYRPDGMVVCDPDKVRPDGVYGAPDLVIEVLSPGTARYDRGHKKDVYERHGVRELWLVNPADKVVEQYLPAEGQKGRLELHEVYAVHPECELKRMKPEELAAIRTEFKCSLYDDLIIRLEDIFRRVP